MTGRHRDLERKRLLGVILGAALVVVLIVVLSQLGVIRA